MDFDRRPSRPFLLWLLALLSAGAFGLALMFGLPPVASECSTRAEIHLFPALLFLLAATALGLPVMLGRSRAARTLLFLAVAALIALYLFGLAQAVPEAVATEVACLTGGA